METASDSGGRSSNVSSLFPDPPLLFAGAVGGPCVMFGVTPFRNALTLAATDQSSTAVQIYRHVFRNGFKAGWVGGLYPMVPAIPQFCVLGPMFHVWKEFLGDSAQAAVLATAICETGLAYGAETRNAQMAAGVTGRMHNPWMPVGPGVSFHLARNVLAMSGLRVLSKPCQGGLQMVFEKTGIKMGDESRTILADMIANLFASALSMPLHQLYGFTVISSSKQAADAPKPSTAEQIAEARAFLRKQFLVPGTNRLSRLAGRDVILRCTYNATIFTIFGFIERTSVKLWPR